MISAFLFIGLIVLIVAIIGWSGNLRLSNHISAIGDRVYPSTVGLWKIFEGQTQIQAVERLLINNRPTPQDRQNELARRDNAWKQIEEGFQQYEKLPPNSAHSPEADQLYQAFLPLWNKWKNAHQDFIRLNQEFEKYGVFNPLKVQLDLLQQGKSNSPEMATAKSAEEALDKLYQQRKEKNTPYLKEAHKALLELLEYESKVATSTREAAEKDVTQSTFWILVGLLIGPTTAVIFGIYFSNTIAKPLGAKIAGVVGVAEKISAGDLTTQVPATEAQDEVGKLESAFRTMSGNLNSLIRQVQKTGIVITTSASQIATSGKQLEATLTEQAASTNQVAATAKEIAATSSELVRTMDEVGHTSQATAIAAGESQIDISHMEKTMKTLTEETDTISSKLGVISEKANNINSIVTTITKVADQTNLLSLNAAIEAEKAGEYGTGFAVVAREIRRLADQTAVATLDIENMVREMQGAVSTGVMEMDKFTKDVERGVEDVRNIGSKLESIISKVQRLTPSFQQVSNSVEVQSQAAVQISETIVQLSEASSQSAASLRAINGAIARLNEAAQDLRLEIARFKVAPS